MTDPHDPRLARASAALVFGDQHPRNVTYDVAGHQDSYRAETLHCVILVESFPNTPLWHMVDNKSVADIAAAIVTGRAAGAVEGGA